MKNFIRDITQDLTFEEVYKKNGWILNITVTDSTTKSLLLCNYVTTPNVLIWSACLCSCAIPDMAEPQELFMKNEKG